jgi:hypothetical protein
MMGPISAWQGRVPGISGYAGFGTGNGPALPTPAKHRCYGPPKVLSGAVTFCPKWPNQLTPANRVSSPLERRDRLVHCFVGDCTWERL